MEETEQIFLRICFVRRLQIWKKDTRKKYHGQVIRCKRL